MNNILGDTALIKRVQEAGPTDKTVLVNMDAISQLPDEFEVALSEVKFDASNVNTLKKSFSDVGSGTYMPTPEMHYKIAEAKGISGGDGSITEPIYETVNISEMTMEPIPQFINMVVGYKCKKFSTVIEEDGRERRSSICESQYNTWNRVTELWAKEEMYTDGYKKAGQYPNKYDTKWKRQANFKAELKFAQAKAETKAHEKTIRELAGLMTGYKMEDLKSGSLVFAKVRKSRKALQMETAAKLTAMSKGEAPAVDTSLLSGNITPEPAPAPEAEIIEDPFTIDQREDMQSALGFYNAEGLIPDHLKNTIEPVLGWLSSDSFTYNDEYWPKVVGILKEIETPLDESQKKKHQEFKA